MLGSRSTLRPRGGKDENAVVGGAKSSSKGGGGGLGAAGAGAGAATVRLALGPAKSLDTSLGANGAGGGSGAAKTPGPSNARRRAFGDISNRKAGRGPDHAAGAAAGAGTAKTPKAVSFQSNLFGPPTKTPGGKSAKKKGLQLQQQPQPHQQHTPFASSRNPMANGNGNANAIANGGANPKRPVSFEPSSSVKHPPGAVMPMTSRKASSSGEGGSVALPGTTSVVRDGIIREDDGGSVSSVELPAGGRIWDPSDFFDGGDDSYDPAAKIAAVNASLDDPSFVMPTFPAAAAASNDDGGDDWFLAKELEELGREDYEALSQLLSDFASEGGDGEDYLLAGLTEDDNDHDDLRLLNYDLNDVALA